VDVRVAEPTCFQPDQYLTRAGLWDAAFFHEQWFSELPDDCSLHDCPFDVSVVVSVSGALVRARDVGPTDALRRLTAATYSDRRRGTFDPLAP
jgi:hypothetical protein